MEKITIAKIRPASWKVYIQGEEQSRHVNRCLAEAGIHVTDPSCQPGLTEPPLYAIIATPKEESPLTQEELLAILNQIDSLELMFESA